MTAEELWQAFCQKENIDISTAYEAWAFGGAPDYLAALVMQGIKTATASGYDLYFLAGKEEPIPQIGDYSVILDSKEQAVCVIQTIKTEVIPFNLVGEDQAYKEGEGNRSLEYWRKVHDEIVLTVRPFNRGAIKVYEKAGFRITKEYYEGSYLTLGNMYVMEAISR